MVVVQPLTWLYNCSKIQPLNGKNIHNKITPASNDLPRKARPPRPSNPGLTGKVKRSARSKRLVDGARDKTQPSKQIRASKSGGGQEKQKEIMKTLSIIKGQGNKSSWMFLCEGDYGDVIKSFKSGKLEDVKTYLSKKYLNFILGEIKGRGDFRHRMVYVTEFARVQKIERKETESERMLANAQSAHTQLRAWVWEGLK